MMRPMDTPKGNKIAIETLEIVHEGMVGRDDPSDRI